MELKKYLSSTIVPWSDTNWAPWDKEEWPATLILPNEMVIKFQDLYKLSSNLKLEMGYSMKFFPKNQTFDYGKLLTGSKHMCPLPSIEGDEAFGNVHCHPSGAAHSAADIAGFRSHMEKAIFVAFVVAAPDRIYAVISRYKKSNFSNVNTNKMQKETEVKLNSYFEKFCPFGKKQRNEIIYGNSNGEGGLINLNPNSALREKYKNVQLQKGESIKSHLITHYQELCLKLTPGYVDHDQSVSEMNISSLKKHGFGVYESDKSNAGKLVCF